MTTLPALAAWTTVLALGWPGDGGAPAALPEPEPVVVSSPTGFGHEGTTPGIPVVERPALQDPEEIARSADAALDALRSLGAEFEQEVVNPILERTTTGRGTLLYQAPDRFRIAYTDPAGDVVVNDGQFVWIYLPSSQPGQVIRQPAERSGVQNPLTYLRDLRRHFDARHAGREDVGGHPTDHLRMDPKSGRAPFARLDVWVDRSTRLPRQVRTTTADDVVTTYTFKTFQRNVELADRLFTFAPPEGVEVFDQ